jgi:molybdenum cofactor cytidylyltransferase
MSDTVCAIVLAAGLGSRYRQIAGAHRNKLLAQCTGRDGIERSVLEHVLVGLRPVVNKIVLLTRPHYCSVAELGLWCWSPLVWATALPPPWRRSLIIGAG